MLATILEHYFLGMIFTLVFCITCFYYMSEKQRQIKREEAQELGGPLLFSLILALLWPVFIAEQILYFFKGGE